MIDFELLLRPRPIIVVLAGSNGAGKSTFYRSFLEQSELPFVNAVVIAQRENLDAYPAARRADAVRRSLVEQRKSLIFRNRILRPRRTKVDVLRRFDFLGLYGCSVLHWHQPGTTLIPTCKATCHPRGARCPRRETPPTFSADSPKPEISPHAAPLRPGLR